MSDALRSAQFWVLAHQAAERPHDENLLGALADHTEDVEPESLRAHLIRHGNPQHFAVPRGGTYAHGRPSEAAMALRPHLDPNDWVQHGWGGVGTPPTAEHAERVTLRKEGVPRHLVGVWAPSGPYAPIATVSRGPETYEAFRATSEEGKPEVPVIRYTLRMPRRTLRLIAPVTHEHLLGLAQYAAYTHQAHAVQQLMDFRRMLAGKEGEASANEAAYKLARPQAVAMKAPAGGMVGGENTFARGGQFLPRTRRRIRDVAARLMKLARPAKKGSPVAKETQEAFRDWVEKLGPRAGVYGFPQVKEAYRSGRRLSPAEVDAIENVLEMPDHLRLPKNRRSSVAERMLWLNQVHDSLNGEQGLARLLKNPKLPESLRVLFHRAAKLGALLHFHPAWKEGFPEALDPIEWYDKTMNPMHVAFHESFAGKNSDHPVWGRLTPERDKLDDRGGRPLWEHAPGQAVAGSVVGLTSPGMTPRLNGNVAYRIIRQAVADAARNGSEQWIDHLPENQRHALAAWQAKYGVSDPGNASDAAALAWLADAQKHHPEAVTGNPAYKSRTLVLADGRVVGTPDMKEGTRFFGDDARAAFANAKKVTRVSGVPILDNAGRLQPKEWSTNASVREGLRTLKRVLAHVRTQPEVASLPKGRERTVAEMRGVAKWLLKHHPVHEVEAMAGHPLNLGFRKGEPEVYGAAAVGPKVGEFIAGLSGPEHADTHVQDMHEARRAEAVQGTVAVTPTGKYNDAKTVSYSAAKRRVLRAAASHALAYLHEHHPDHPVLKLKNNTRAVQALEWIAQKSLVDPDGLLDFHSEAKEVGGPNTDYVSAANDILAPRYGGKTVFAPSGKRIQYKAAERAPKPGLAVRQEESEKPERLSRPGPEDDLFLPPLWAINLMAQRLVAAGADPSGQNVLRALILAGLTGPQPGRIRLARPAEPTTPEHVAYVSPSTRENSTLADAMKGMQSPETERQRKDAMLLPTVRAVHTGLGFWKDGAEESNAVHVGDPQYLARVGAELGRAYGQKAVLLWREQHDGPDARHLIVVPETDPEKIHADMMRHGIEYKTLVPVPGGTRIEAVDGGDQMRPEFDGYAREAGALSHQVRAGSATVLGADDRDEARKVFEGVIANGGRVGGPVRLSRADEQAGFEKAIDDNPRNATTHLAYADWLDEHDQPEEASFRRSLGKWLDKHQDVHDPRQPDKRIYSSSTVRVKMPWQLPLHDLPEGVAADRLPRWVLTRGDGPQGLVPNWRWDNTGKGYMPADPTHGAVEFYGPAKNNQLALRYEKYRHLEQALRRAFRM